MYVNKGEIEAYSEILTDIELLSFGIVLPTIQYRFKVSVTPR